MGPLLLPDGKEPATRIAVHGTSASVFIPADSQARVALLRHCVQSGLFVTGYAEYRARVEEIYFALAQDKAAPAAGGTLASKRKLYMVPQRRALVLSPGATYGSGAAHTGPVGPIDISQLSGLAAVLG